MAEETPMSPITAAEPPKANPLAKPAATHTSTLKLKPVIRKPATPGTGVTQSALRPGLNLPPKPGVATAGLKLPPKPGVATAGLKLPPKPGATVSALRPGVKLPAKPVIRKPGAVVPPPAVPASAAPVAAAPSPVPAVEKPTAPAAVAPSPAPAVEKPAPAVAPVVDLSPVEPVMATPAQEPKPAPEAKPAAAASESLDMLKLATQSLKSATAPVPPQAILRKTGMIADQALSDAQKQAAKSKTSRISLSEAIGAAPVKNENAPMKTIRIKRPTDIPGIGQKPAATPAPAPAAAAPVASEMSAPAPAPAEKATTVTQRKTLKIARPGGSAVRPSGKFGVKKPSAPAAPKPAAPVESDAAVADIPDIPDLPPTSPFPAPAPAAAATEADVPAFVSVLGVLVQAAACIGMGALAWLLYQDALIF